MKVNKCKRISKGGRTHIIIKSLKGQNLNLREIEDMNNGTMEHIVPIEVMSKNKAFTLSYDISNYITLEQYMHTLLDRAKFAQIVVQILNSINDLSEKYYNPQNLILEMDKVYINPSSDKVLFLFVPILYYSSVVSLKDFLIQLIYNTTFDSSEDISYVDACLEILQRNMNFSSVELEEYLRKFLDGNSTDTKPKEESGTSEKEGYDPFGQTFTRESTVCNNEESVFDDFKSTGSLSSIGAENNTVLLGKAEPSYLKQVRTGRKFVLDEDETRIGKRQCTIEISDNPAVSKQHAAIRKKSGQYYIIDLGSTNGTKIKGSKIIPGEEVLLNDETEFELANEKMIFYQ